MSTDAPTEAHTKSPTPVYVSDYSRYLRKDISARGVIAWNLDV